MKKRRIIAILTAIAMLVTLLGFIIKRKIEIQEENKKEKIVEYYGDDSFESEIIKYIEISEKIEKLKLDEYLANNELIETYTDENMILSDPEEILNKIEVVKNFSNRGLSKNLNTMQEIISTITYLKQQEILINEYIYSSYSVVHSNITEVAKKYAAEVYGINSPSKIILIKDTKNYSSNQPPEYTIHYEGNQSNITNRNIKKGIDDMIYSDTSEDYNDSDNNLYNDDRNDLIIDILSDCVKLSEKIENDNLYSKKEAKKLMN